MTTLSIPVQPDAETAREWAREELSKPAYQDEGTSWFLRAIEWINGLLDNVNTPTVGGFNLTTAVWVLIIVAAVALVIWLIVGPLRRSRRRTRQHSVFDDDERTSTQMRDDAERWAREGNWSQAVLDMYRVTVRSLEERDILDDRPGVTAFEAAVDTGVAFPDVREAMLHDSDVFDAIRYGAAAGTREDYEHAKATNRALSGRSRLQMSRS